MNPKKIQRPAKTATLAKTKPARPTGKVAKGELKPKARASNDLVIPDKLELVAVEPRPAPEATETPKARAPRGSDSACDQCGSVGSVRFVLYKGNVGMLIMRRESEVKGNLCADCDHAAFKRLTLTTLGLGWWGHVSLLVTPFFLANNVLYRLNAPGLPRPRRDGKLSTNWAAVLALIVFVFALFVAICLMPTSRPPARPRPQPDQTQSGN